MEIWLLLIRFQSTLRFLIIKKPAIFLKITRCNSTKQKKTLLKKKTQTSTKINI